MYFNILHRQTDRKS